MSKRIYVVGGTHLVRAYSPAAARNFVAAKTITSELAKQDTLVKMLSEGAKVEESTAPEQADVEDEAPDVQGNGALHSDPTDQTLVSD